MNGVTWTWLDWGIASLASFIWFYIVARVITRAVLRTLSEKKEST